MKLVSIVIRTYNEQKHIGKLLDAIYHQMFDPERLEVIVVDSGSTDHTLEIVRSYPARIVTIHPSQFSFGFSLNQGIEAASGEYVLMISAHCEPVRRDWIQKMIQPFAGENIALVYGRQIGKDTTKYSEHQIFKSWFPEKTVSKQESPFCNNANCAIRRSLWKENRYDEKLTGLEDLDWAKQLLKKGYYLSYQSEAVIYHIHDEAYQQIYNRYRREAIALKHIFPEVKFGLYDFIMMSGVNIFNDSVSAIKDRCFWKNLASIFLFRLHQFFGTYTGHSYNKPEIAMELKRRFYYPSNRF
jgi:rhamnosyltransferase